jgi:hypothetical protein
MGNFDDRYRTASQAEAERRLRAVQVEMVRPVATVQGVAALLKQIDPEVVKQLPAGIGADEFEQVVSWLEQAGEDLQAVLDTLTLPVHRH